MKTLRLRLVAGGCVTLGLLAGCSDATAGDAQPTGGTITSSGSSEPGQPSRTTTSSGSASASPLAKVDPCSLLSDAERASFSLAAGERTKVGRSRGCDWKQSGVWGLRISLKEELAFKDADLRGATPNRVDIGRHEAYRVENSGGGKGGCEVFVVTGASSFAQVIGDKGVDTVGACERAVAVAKIIDPKLP